MVPVDAPGDNPSIAIKPDLVLEEGTFMERWWCMDCKAPVGLDKHGRCDVCESEAVDLLERGRGPVKMKTVARLEVSGALQSA